MGAALLALGQALVDAVAVGMVGDNEDAGLGGRGSVEQRSAQAKSAGRDRILHR